MFEGKYLALRSVDRIVKIGQGFASEGKRMQRRCD